MLSDILSRLVETVAEQGEDMQVRAQNCKIVPIKSWQIQSLPTQFFFFPFNAAAISCKVKKQSRDMAWALFRFRFLVCYKRLFCEAPSTPLERPPYCQSVKNSMRRFSGRCLVPLLIACLAVLAAVTKVLYLVRVHRKDGKGTER